MTLRRTAVVGLGGISNEWLRVLGTRDDLEVVALVDRDTTRAAAQRLAFGLSCPVGSDLEPAIAEQRVDLVIVLTPPGLHRQVAEPALAAGCDVIVEKPLAADLRDAVALVEAAEAAGPTLAVMQNRRYHPAIRVMRDHVARGSVGVLVDIAADMFLWHRFPNTFLAEIDSPLLRDMAIHQFDMARAITGADARAVQALEWSSPTSWMAGAAAASATFELSNGTVFSYRGSWVAEGAQTSYDGTWRISGTHGAMTWDGTGDVVLETVERPDGPYEPGREARTRLASNLEPGTTSHALALAAILDALRAGEPPETVAHDNLLSLAMVDAAIRSLRARRTIEVAGVLVDAGWAATGDR